MTPDQIWALCSVLSGMGIGVVVGGLVAYMLMRYYMTSYLGEKGKNLATKEDIQAITKLVEEAKEPFVTAVENLKGRHQLRMAAIDKRLQAHQDAFTLWRQILDAVYTEEIGSTVQKCQAWWEQNCVYLEPQVRDGFLDAYSAAASHAQLLQGRENVQLVKDNWSRITRFPDILFDAVELPRFNEREQKALNLVDPKGVPNGIE